MDDKQIGSENEETQRDNSPQGSDPLDEEFDRQQIEFENELYANAELDREIEELKAENARLWPAVQAKMAEKKARMATALIKDDGSAEANTDASGHVLPAPVSEDAAAGDGLEVPGLGSDPELEVPETRHSPELGRSDDRSNLIDASAVPGVLPAIEEDDEPVHGDVLPPVGEDEEAVRPSTPEDGNELPLFVRNHNNTGWVPIEQLADPAASKLRRYHQERSTFAPDAGRFRLAYVDCQHEIGHHAKACMECVIHREDRRLCKGHVQDLEACEMCQDAATVPCARVIENPNGTSFALGFLPLPADLRQGVAWIKIAFWIRDEAAKEGQQEA